MSVIVALAEPKSPMAACVAVMRVVPKARGVTELPIIDATAGFDEVKVHGPLEVDLGGIKLMLATLSFMIVMSPKEPSEGVRVATVNRMDVPTIFQFGVPPWTP